MNNYIVKQYKREHILLIGKEQSGKSHYVMDQSKKRMDEYGIIQIHFAYATHNIEDNQNRHVKRVFGAINDVHIVDSLGEIRRTKQLLQQGDKGVLNDGRLIISCIGNYHTLSDILGLVSQTNHKYKFDVYIDEGDTYGVDHDQTHSTVQKDNLINSIVDSPQVARVTEITATPLSQIVSNSNFTQIIILPPQKEGYHGVADFEFDTTLTDADLKLFEQAKSLPLPIKQWILDGLHPGVCSLVSVTHKTEIHRKQAIMISRTVKSQAAVVVVNSDKKMKNANVFVNGTADASLCGTTTTDTLDRCWAAGFKSVFVVGQKSLNRSVTIEDSHRNYDACRALFNCSVSSPAAEILQRVCRIAGYGPWARQVFCTFKCRNAIKTASINRDNLVEEIVPLALATQRHEALKGYLKLLNCNLFGTKSNGFAVTDVRRQKHISTTHQPEFPIRNEIHRIPLHDLPPSVQTQLIEEAPARIGTPLHSWIKNQLPVKYVYRSDAAGQNNIPMHIPNNLTVNKRAKGTYRRDLLWHYKDETLTLSHQDEDEWDADFSIEHPETGLFLNYVVAADPTLTETRVVSTV